MNYSFKGLGMGNLRFFVLIRHLILLLSSHNKKNEGDSEIKDLQAKKAPGRYPTQFLFIPGKWGKKMPIIDKPYPCQ
jgi:hypothetical protein